MATGFLFIAGIILFGILTLLCLVFTVISFATSKKGKFVWTGAFLFSLLGLVLCIYLLTSRIVNKAKNFASNIEKSFISNLDSVAYKGYNMADSLNSEQIKYLKLLEDEEFKDKVPAQFYNYLGFRDYYRLPLLYPYSIHCSDAPSAGSLYNEKDVMQFDANNNGEIDCNLNNIQSFIFDKNILLAKILNPDSAKRREVFVIYHFVTGKREDFKSIEGMSLRAKQLNFSRPVKLVSCEDYYNLF